MKLSEFDFHLPESLIAQTPTAKREESRLMVISVSQKTIRHHHFFELPTLLPANTQLVFNNTKVLKARMFGKKQETGAQIEILALHPLAAPNTWQALIKPSKRVKPGTKIDLDNHTTLEILEKQSEPGMHTIRFPDTVSPLDVLERFGELPLPPYIKATPKDEDRYQTVLAKTPGAVAAPTAGLHFTPSLIETLKTQQIGIHELTLHVGYGTFKPIEAENILDHHMHKESFDIPENTTSALNHAIEKKWPIIPVGTTSLRAIESAYTNGIVKSGPQTTNLFIYPGHGPKLASGMITNFHLPKSSLLVLISALAGIDLVREAYQTAISQKYRFYSFGDAMLILP